jgi:protein SCO1/2
MKIAALLVATGIGVLAFGAPELRAGDGMEIGVDRSARGTFSLVDHRGRRVTERNFSGRFLLVFFGYTFCPDVCPTDLQTIGMAVKQLGEAGKRVQPIFVTLDPERDTADILVRYVTHFHPRFLGLTGSPDEIALAAQTYGVLFMKAIQGEAGKGAAGVRYVIDHSAIIYLLGPDGRFLAAYRHGIGPGELASALSKHLKGGRS